MTDNEDVTQIFEEELVRRRGSLGKVPVLQRGIDGADGNVEPVEKPLFRRALLARWQGRLVGHKRGRGLADAVEVDEAHAEEAKLGRIPHLVAELAVALDAVDLHVDVAAYESARVSTVASRLVEEACSPPEV